MIWFLNGRYLPESEAKIPINDLSVLRGYGVFDFLVTYHRRPFMLSEHLKRLFNSARLIGLNIPYSRTQLAQIVKKTIARNQGESMTIHIIVTGGVSSTNFFPEGKSHVAILIHPRKPHPVACYSQGIKLQTHQFQRYVPEAKHLDYLTAVVTRSRAVKQGYSDVLYTYRGKVLECTRSNFYLIKNGVLCTPDRDLLPGITRQVILKISKKYLKVKKQTVLVKDLKTADEAFISASDIEIMPVIKIDRMQINNGKPGRFTKLIISDFRRLTRKTHQ